jgi:cell fate regulator YaaT (PSP1 superfamily)
MNIPEYLVSYGRAGDFSRFRPASPLDLKRGDCVVIESHQGQELGVVLCPATDEHSHFLSHTRPGALLRRATDDDHHAAIKRAIQAQAMFEDARALAFELGLPIEVLDVEITLDGTQAVIHHLRQLDCDYRAFVSRLAAGHGVRVIMENLALPSEASQDSSAGCGRPDCGQGKGGCTTCSLGGGCASGSCGKATPPEDVAALLAGIGRQLDPPCR